MLIPRVSLILLELLKIIEFDKNCSETNEINLMHRILRAANEELPIETIAYFGQRDLMEPFISPLMSGTPKVIIEYALGQQNYQFEFNFNTKIFFLAFGNLEPSINWQYLYDILTSMQSHVRGIFIASKVKGLQEHFDWCWRKGFLNVLVLVVYNNRSQPFKLYTYRPFPILEVIELPVNESTSLYFSNKLNNLRGYKVRTAMEYDPPRVFALPHPSKSNETIYAGYAARTYIEFLKYHNAGMEIIERDKSSPQNILAVIEQLNQGVVDLSMNPYLPYAGTRISYPVYMMRWCILVPAKGEIPGYIYFLRPFQLEVWLMCIGMLFYLSFIKSLNQYIDSKFHFTNYRRIDIGQGLIETLRLILYMPAPPMYQNFRWHYVWNYGVVAIFGFMLSNLYLGLETSFLSKIIFEKQIDTLAEMVDQNISIHAIEHEIPIILKNLGLPKGFADLLVPRNSTEMINDLFSLRLGQAYVARSDTIFFILNQQKHQIYPKFHLAEECIATIPVGFLMPSHSQFKIELDVFTLQSAAAGLIFRWFGLTITEAFRAGILRYQIQKVELVTALSLEHFHFAFLVLIYGLIFSSIVFFVEQISRFKIRIWLKR